MARKKHDTSEANVWSHCEKILGKDVEPTNMNVKDSIGGGSYRDIRPHVASWKLKNKSRIKRLKRPERPIPDEVFHKFADAYYYGVDEAAGIMVDQQTEYLQAVIEEKEAEAQAMKEEMIKMNQKIESLEAEIKRLTAMMKSAFGNKVNEQAEA